MPAERGLATRIARFELPLVALWIGLAWGLSELTTRVVDWYVMTDELLYERLAISVAEDGSPLPHVHGELVPNVGQLYPLLLGIAFRNGLVQDALHDAHVLNAWLMSSACIPAFLLARRVTGRRLAAYAVALLAVCVPWILLSSFLLTEAAGYPAFLWAVFAVQRTVAAPSRWNDVLGLVAVAIAVLARTQFIVLLAVVPLAVLGHELAKAGGVRAGARQTVRSHPILTGAYAVLVTAALVAASLGRLSDVLGTYGSTLGGSLLPNGFARSFAEHFAVLALGLGVLPFLVGVAWLLANAVRPPEERAELHAFACLGSLTIVALTFEVTLFDLRFGTGSPRDRYLFYVVPLVLVGLACAIGDRRWPRWSLVVPTAVVATGFATAGFPLFARVNVDFLVAVLHEELLELAGSVDGARALLAVATVVLAVLFVQASILFRHRIVAAVLAALTLAALPLETAYAFDRLFREDGTAGRPLTLQQGGVFSWVDQKVGTKPDVTIVPYPNLPGEYWSSVAYWWDLEFWNRSVARAVHLPGQYEWTPSTFPKLRIEFDPETGRASISPTRYVAHSAKETRFRIAGTAISNTRDVLLVDAGPRWRADWVASNLHDDGWTKPGATARVRVFATPDQKRAIMRGVSLGVRAPVDVAKRTFAVSTNLERWQEVATNGPTFFRDRQRVRAAGRLRGHRAARRRLLAGLRRHAGRDGGDAVPGGRRPARPDRARGRARPSVPPARLPLMRRALPALGLWIVLASALSVLTTRFRDWFAMPNELLYERRAISIAQSLSPLPRVREELVSTFDQLYPLLVAPAFRWGYVPDELWTAHLLNAWIMSSACIPAFLLARRLTALWWPPYVLSLLTVCMPWIVVSSFLLTEVAAYPAFVWAVLAMHVATATPSARHDVLALLAIGLAFFGRTQLAVLLFLLPLTILAVELGRKDGVREALRASVAQHRLLTAVYGALTAVGLVLAVVGRLPGVLGVYGATISGAGASVSESLTLTAFGGSLVEHVATFALGLGILPFVVGVAWLLANLVRPPASRELHAFACLGAITVVATMLQVTIFDLRFGADFVHDRYLFYLVPLVVCSSLCAVLDARAPRWSLLAPAAFVCLGFVVGELPGFLWRDLPTVNSDAPISALFRPLVEAAGSLTSARGLLVGATIVLVVLFVQATILFRQRLLATLFAGFLLVTVPTITGYMFVRLFDATGWSGRPVSAFPDSGFDWVDRTVGGSARVAMVPYPVSTSYFVNQGVWRDYEFWNRSVRRDVQFPEKTFLFTGDTFAKSFPRFDPKTGASDVSLAQHILQANQESRFRIAGTVRVLRGDVMLIDAAMPWRLDWLSTGLHADGWTKPGKVAQIRVFAVPGQRSAITRGLSIGYRAPEDVAERPIVITSNLDRQHGVATPATQRTSIQACVPKNGYAVVTVRVLGASAIPGDLRDIGLSEQPREGGVFLNEIALADELGAPCRPRSG